MKRLIYFLIVCIIISIIILILVISKKANINTVDNNLYMENLENYSIEEVKDYCRKNNLELNIINEYSDTIKKDKVISQSILPGNKIVSNDKIDIVISLGIDYEKYSVNELGGIPVMMYHQIKNMKNIDTKYPGGNVDIDGYTRTSEAFRNDLEFYYKKGYRMIRLNDYVNGKIDVELGYSPIILTFDDGLNEVSASLDENGNLIIDPNSALGILEEYKMKYPDYNVTATFFLNNTLFYNSELNEKIMKYLIDKGYDIGNHTYTHPNINNITKDKTIEETGKMYQKLDEIIPGKYVNIVALPYGNPNKSSENFSHILKGEYNGKTYNTISTLRVAWSYDYSPFNKDFDKTYIKRIRAYDNNGKDFDIEYNFNLLEKDRYISDGDIDTVVIKEKDKTKINTSLNLVIY